MDQSPDIKIHQMNDDTNFLHLQMETCNLHAKQLQTILKDLETRPTITADDVENFGLYEKALIDSLAHRFSKLQTTLGEKVFPALLESLKEDIQSKSVIDILNRLEKLGILSSVNFWQEMRETRNDISHDYPDDDIAKAERINLCIKNSHRLLEFFANIQDYIAKANV